MYENFSFVRWISLIGTWLQISRLGTEVGVDSFGNRYFREKIPVAGRKARRWVIYNGEPEASKIPPEWHRWLHYTADEPIKADSPFRQDWQKPHQPNLSGTPDAHLPSWHSLARDRKEQETVYQAWKP